MRFENKTKTSGLLVFISFSFSLMHHIVSGDEKERPHIKTEKELGDLRTALQESLIPKISSTGQ